MSNKNTPDAQDGLPMLHMKKLCVGISSVDELVELMDHRAKRSADPSDAWFEHVTRMRPKRDAEILAGGSLYWVVKGQIVARQQVLALREVEEGGKSACAIRLSAHLIKVWPKPHRPFQGWRYLKAEDAPLDLDEASTGEDGAFPDHLRAELQDLGIF